MDGYKKLGCWPLEKERRAICRSNAKPYYQQKILYQCASKTTTGRCVVYVPLCLDKKISSGWFLFLYGTVMGLWYAVVVNVTERKMSMSQSMRIVDCSS